MGGIGRFRAAMGEIHVKLIVHPSQLLVASFFTCGIPAPLFLGLGESNIA